MSDNFTVISAPDEFEIVVEQDDWVIYTKNETQFTLEMANIGGNDTAVVVAAKNAAQQAASDASTSAGNAAQSAQDAEDAADAAANYLLPGGTVGQVLTKASNTDFDLQWSTPAGGGDMLASIYDPSNLQLNVYSADSHVDGTTNKVFTGAEKTKLANIATGATANDTDANLKNRANHTGTQDADTITDGTTNKVFTGAEKTKLANIATGATANDTDANLKNRANHTGTQLAATISDFSTAADARISAAIGVTAQAYSALLTQIAGLTGPGADRILFWDETASSFAYLTIGTNLSISGTTLNATGGGGGGGGDMYKIMYDPNAIEADVFDVDNHVSGVVNKVFTGTEQTKLANIATGATANDTDANLKNRANHTGTQSADTITDGTTNKVFTGAEKTKLTGIATGATANDTDANLKNRANHTGTQLAATISDFTTAADARISAAIGVTAQAYAANLTTWAGIAPSANAQSLMLAANYAAMRSLLDLEAGTDFYSISAADAAFAALSHTHTVSQLSDASANGRSLIQAANYAAMRALLDLEAGTDFYSISAANAAFAAASHSHTVSQLSDASANARSFLQAANYAAMKALLSLVKGDVGLGNVDNTSDAAKFTSPSITGTIREDVYTITDGAGFVINPANGSVQRVTLGANRTPVFTGWADGDSVTLLVADGTAYSITWTGGPIVWAGGAAPTLATTGYTEINITQENSVKRGVKVGEFAS